MTYSDKTTVAAIGDHVLYDSGLDSGVSRIVSLFDQTNGDVLSHFAKLANGATALLCNCKRLATSQEVC